MAFVGLQYAVAAPIETETPGAPITYKPGLVIGKMIGANINYTRNSDPLYADDTIAEDDNSVVGGTISVNVDDLTDEAQVAVAGLVEEEAEDAGPKVYRETGDASPYVGVGYMRVRRKAGVTSYVAYWVHKCLLAVTQEQAQTKGQTISWQTPTLEGQIMGVVINADGKTDFRIHTTFTTQAEAKAWLDERANIVKSITQTAAQSQLAENAGISK